MSGEPYPGPKPFRHFKAHFRYVRDDPNEKGLPINYVVGFAFLSYVGITPLLWWASHRY